MDDERREYQRLNLTAPLQAWFGDFSVQLVEVSASGAAMIHDDPIQTGSRALLRFTWRENDLEITAEVARTTGQRSGVHFVEEDATLRELIRQSATELLLAREANAGGDRERNRIGEGTLTAASRGARMGRGYLTFQLVDGAWKSRLVDEPKQPENGFTVLADEPDEQIEMLCRTFEAGDPESRRMTKLIAQLSVTR
jgi:hypothetical protein